MKVLANNLSISKDIVSVSHLIAARLTVVVDLRVRAQRGFDEAMSSVGRDRNDDH